MASIEELSIDIISNLGNADKALDRLSASLSKISAALGGFDTGKFSAIGNGVGNLAVSMKSASGIKAADFNRISNGIDKLNRVDVSNLAAVGRGLSSLLVGFQGLSGVADGAKNLATAASSIAKMGGVKVQAAINNMTNIGPAVSALNNAFAGGITPLPNISEFVSSVAKLGGKATTNAITNLPQLANSLTQTMNTLSKAPKVSQNVISLTNALANLASQGNKARSASNGLATAMDRVSTSGRRASTGVLSFGASIRSMLGAAGIMLGIRQIIQFGKSCIELGSSMTETQNVVDVAFGSMASKANAFAKTTATQFGVSELSAKQYSGVLMSMYRSLGVAQENAANMAMGLTGRAGDIASFYNISTDDAYYKIRSAVSGETEPMKQLGVNMNVANLNAFALSNGFGKLYNKMTLAEQAMLRYQYIMSTTDQTAGDFVRTQGSFANQLRILQLQFQQFSTTMGQGFINIIVHVVRALNTLLAYLQTVANAFRALTALIFGDNSAQAGGGIAGGIEDAEDAAGGLAGNLGGAAQAAKDLANATSGIDELNIISPNDKGGSGGGGAGGGADVDYGELPSGESFIDRLNKELEDAIKNHDWEFVGSYIGDALTKAMDDIDWDRIYESARNFGTGFAQFLNGLISPELFGATGRTIAGALNTAIYSALAFGEEFNWENLGASIASGINNFFSTFDFAALATTINVWAGGLLTALITALDETDWSLIGTKIGQFFETLDFSDLSEKAGKAIWKAINAGLELYAAMFKAAPIETTIITAVAALKFTGLGAVLANAMLTSIKTSAALKFKSLANLVGEKIRLALLGISIKLPSIALDLSTAVPAIIGMPGFDALGAKLVDDISEGIRSTFGDKIADAINGSVLALLGTGIGVVFGGPIGAVIGGIAGLFAEKIRTQGFDAFWKNFNASLWDFKYADSLWEKAKTFFDTALSATNFFDFGVNIIAGIVSGFTSGIVRIFEPIHNLFSYIVGSICEVFGIHSPAENMKPLGGYILEGVIEGFRNTFSEWADALNEWFDDHIAPWFTTQKWSELYDSIKTSLKTKWDETVGQWSSDIQTWWDLHVSPWFTTEKWEGIADNIKKAIKTKWDSTVGQWKTDLSNWWTNDVAKWFDLETWKTEAGHIKTAIIEKFAETVSQWKLDIQAWWDNDVTKWFSYNTWLDALKELPNAFKKGFELAINSAKMVFDNFIDGIKRRIESLFDSDGGLDDSDDWDYGTNSPVRGFATGGFPNTGEMFLARERGPELVGRLGGRTAVANNDQIVAGIESGVYNAVSKAMSEVLSSYAQNGDVAIIETHVDMDGRTLVKQTDKVVRRGGFNFRTT